MEKLDIVFLRFSVADIYKILPQGGYVSLIFHF